MEIKVQFYSYFKELTGCAETSVQVSEQASIDELLNQLFLQFPKLAQMQKSMLVAVGVDYQPKTHILKNGDEVSLFPPVQGG
jgi:molybdopterin converting factor small subunit